MRLEGCVLLSRKLHGLGITDRLALQAIDAVVFILDINGLGPKFEGR